MSQFPQHRISVTDDLRSGNAVAADSTSRGVPLAGAEAQAFLAISLGAPAAAATNNISVAAVITGASNAVIGGVLAASGVATLDVPRSLQMVSSNAGDTTQTVTVTGTDKYGVTLRETRTLNGTTIVVFQKAFKRVIQIAVSATTVGNFSMGTTDVLGLPYAPVVGGFLSGIVGENTADAGTYVAPVRTAASATTGDVRGTYDPAAACNGALVFKVRVAVQNGPNNSDAYGVAQF